MTAEDRTALYPAGGMRCSVELDEWTGCNRPAPWVAECEFVAKTGRMISGWSGRAWCDEHRPEVDDDRPTGVETRLLIDRISSLLAAHRGQGLCISSCSIYLPEEFGGGGECDCDMDLILDVLAAAADLLDPGTGE